MPMRAGSSVRRRRLGRRAAICTRPIASLISLIASLISLSASLISLIAPLISLIASLISLIASLIRYAKIAQPLPSLVPAGSWRVAAGAGLGWRDAPELRAVVGAELERMLTTTPRVVHLVGSTHSAQVMAPSWLLHGSFMAP